MNILYLNHYAGSPEMGMEFRPFYLSREWVRMGHRVTIVAGDYSHLRQHNPVVFEDFQAEAIGGITYCWVQTGSYEGNGVARALTMFRFVSKLCTHAKELVDRYRPDVVIASSTYPLDTYAAQIIARLSNAKYVHEVHDMWPATLYEIGGMSRRHPFVQLLQRAEDDAYRKCDLLVSLAPYTKPYMVEHGLDPGKFVNIQNGIDLDAWNSPSPIPDEHIALLNQLNDKFIVGFFGGHALSNALDYLLDVAKLEDDKDIAFVLVGDGVEKPRLFERSTVEGLSNVYFLPPVPKTSIPTLLTHFDCSYMGGVDSPLYRFGLCLNKMYDSMMAGIPIICAFSAPEGLVSQYQCGLEVSPQPIANVIESIDFLKSLTPEERRVIGQRGRNAVLEHFTYAQLAQQFMNAIEAC